MLTNPIKSYYSRAEEPQELSDVVHTIANTLSPYIQKGFL